VKLSSSPKNVSAGQPWVVDITVLQHGLATYVPGQGDDQERCLPGPCRLPERRHVAVRGLRRLHAVRRRADAQVQGGGDRAGGHLAAHSGATRPAAPGLVARAGRCRLAGWVWSGRARVRQR
jgi:hypothetical protein